MFKHYTVLQEESVNGLNIKPDGVYVDATVGGAGHSKLIASRLSKKGKLFCFDQDSMAIENAKIVLDGFENVTIIKSNFVNLLCELKMHNVEKIDGILFDLGVSSVQIDQAQRGFSYIHEGPLDMRMDNNSDFKAQDIIDTYSVEKMCEIFKKYGEEKHAKHYANVISENRHIKTTMELSDLLIRKTPKKIFYNLNSHPAIRIFQALRIEVNKELDVFENTLIDCKGIMNSGGRICVISFHSLEDRISKYYFNQWSELKEEFKQLPIVPKEYKAKYKKITNKPIVPGIVELSENSRSQSAKLRILEKL